MINNYNMNFLKNLFSSQKYTKEENECFWATYRAKVNLYQKLSPSKDYIITMENCLVFFL